LGAKGHYIGASRVIHDCPTLKELLGEEEGEKGEGGGESSSDESRND